MKEGTLSYKRQTEFLKSKDKKYIESLYISCFPKIQVLVMRNSGNVEEAKDLFQESLIIAFKKVQSPGFELSCNMDTYIYAIASKYWLYQLRKRGNAEGMVAEFFSHQETVDEKGIENAIVDKDKENLFRDYFQQLTEDCQKVMKLFLSGESMKKIAQLMDYQSEGYARKKKFACQKKLIESIKKDPVYQELM